jgi:hypothetical protein
MKIPNGEGSENACISKTDNAMANRNRTTEQTIADKTLQRKLIFFAYDYYWVDASASGLLTPGVSSLQ